LSTAEPLNSELHRLLALVLLEPLPHGESIEGLPGVWSPRPAGESGARVQLAAGEHLMVNGIATGGCVDIDLFDPARPPDYSVGLDTEQTVVVIRFENSEAGHTWVGVVSTVAPRLRQFQGVSSYPVDDRWRIPVAFTAAREADRFSMTQRLRTGQQVTAMNRAGWFEATIDGQPYRFSVDQISGFAYVTFRDAGSGTESYGAGRVVRLPADPATIDVLDFNQAAVLPCAYNPLMDCPLPPAGNVIRSVVRAGQRDVLFDETL